MLPVRDLLRPDQVPVPPEGTSVTGGPPVPDEMVEAAREWGWRLTVGNMREALGAALAAAPKDYLARLLVERVTAAEDDPFMAGVEINDLVRDVLEVSR
jgi:hypothetical protein